MSDNGYQWGEHGLDFKGYSYDDSIRVPMYLRWPGHVVAGATDSRLVANIDVAPTIADAVGRPRRDAPDGRALDAERRRRAAPASCSSGTRQTADWVGLRSARRPRTTSSTTTSVDNQSIRFREYYDLTSDPWEMNNLLGDGNAANDPNTAALSAQIAADRACARRELPVATPEYRRHLPLDVCLAILAGHDQNSQDFNGSPASRPRRSRSARAAATTRATAGPLTPGPARPTTTGTTRHHRDDRDRRDRRRASGPGRPTPSKSDDKGGSGGNSGSGGAAAGGSDDWRERIQWLRRRQRDQPSEKQLTGKNVKSTAKTVCTSFLPTQLEKRPQERQEVRGGHRQGLLARLSRPRSARARTTAASPG